MRHLAAALLALALLGAALTSADEPLPPPKPHTVHSANLKFYAVSEPGAEATTTVYRDADKAKLWSMKGWFRSLWLADDGEHLVVGYGGLNLIPVKHAKDEVMVRFFAKGELVAKVTLDQLIANEASLERTVSHFHWGLCQGFDDKGRFVVSTVEGKEHLFDPKTGKLVETRAKK